MSANYIIFDFETGGTNPDFNPILTGYFAALDENLQIIDDLDLKIFPKDSMVIEQEALDANKIDLEKLKNDPQTVSLEEASKKLEDFLKKNCNKKSKPRPMGHNVAFDIAFTKQLMPKDKWESYVHYGFLCTFSITSFLKDVGFLPKEVGNLSSLVKHYEIKMLNAHEAKDDVLMTLDVYKKMCETLKGLKNNSSGLSIDILSMLEK